MLALCPCSFALGCERARAEQRCWKLSWRGEDEMAVREFPLFTAPYTSSLLWFQHVWAVGVTLVVTKRTAFEPGLYTL